MKGKPNEIYRCVICGKEFRSSWGSYKYCSSECRKKVKAKYREVRRLRIIKGIDKDFNVIDEKNISPSDWLRLRFSILLRDGFKCQYCGRIIKNGIRLEVDHIIPRSKGGTYDKKNLITSCNLCNLGKLDILLKEREIALIKRRKTP